MREEVTPSDRLGSMKNHPTLNEAADDDETDDDNDDDANTPHQIRHRAATRESEKAEAERYWRRLVAIRQRRRRGTAGAAAAVNNLGVLLVEISERDSAPSEEGRKLLKVRVVFFIHVASLLRAPINLPM